MKGPILKSDWRYYEITIPLKALSRFTPEVIAVEVEHALHHRLPTGLVPLAGSTIQREEAAVEGETE